MKNIARIVVGVLFLTGGMAQPSYAHDTVKDAIASARQKMKASDFDGAAKDAEEALRLAGTDSGERVNVLLLEANLAEARKDLTGAQTIYEKILAGSDALPAQRVVAINKLAEFLKTGRQLGAAHIPASVQSAGKQFDAIRSLYLQALDSKEFQSSPERADLLIALARLHEANYNFAKAGDYYAQAFDFPQTSRSNRLAALRSLGATLVAQNRFEDARTQFARISELPDVTPTERSKAILDAAQASEAEGDFPAAKASLLQAAQVEGLTPGQRTAPLAALAKFYAARTDWEGFMKTLAEIRAVNGSVDLMTLRQQALLAKALGKEDEEEKVWDEVLAQTDLPDRALVEPLNKKLALLAARRDPDALKGFLSGMAGRKLVPVQRATLDILSAVLAVPAGDFTKFQAPTFAEPDAEKLANAYFEAGKVMMYLRDFDAARFLAQKGESLFVKSPERLYEVPFVEQAPRGVSGWLNSPLLKDASRREARFEEYNKQAAALLVNDVNAERTVVADAAGKKAPVAFFMAADAQGWHVFIEYKDEEAEQVLAGLLPGGGLEIYMVPGMSEPYYQLMLDVPSGKRQFIDWSSPNRHYRPADDFVTTEVAPIPGGFGVSLVFPWEMIYDKLPQADDTWPFGLVNFGRGGAFTWGSGQVHELSRFGKVSFPAITKALPAIHRWIVLRAFAKYKKSAETAKVVWNDPEKGDPEFFETVLLPEMNRLGELGKHVSTKMSEKDSERLFQETVPAWMEFGYWIAERRTHFLADKLMAK